MTNLELVKEFPYPFYVKNSSASAEYKKFIECLRETLAKGYLHNLPVLPLDDQRSYLDVELRTEKSNIIVRLQECNVYLVGYRMGSTGTWWEFKSANPRSQLIDGSSCLGYDGGYNRLENAAKGRNDIKLGRYSLIDAVNGLDTPLPERDNNNDNEKKKANRKKAHEKRAQFLIVVIQMICESIRFTPISDCIINNYQKSFDFHLEEWMIVLEGNWGKLSRHYREGNLEQFSQHLRLVTFQPGELINGTRCESLLQMARAILGIVKGERVKCFGVPSLGVGFIHPAEIIALVEEMKGEPAEKRKRKRGNYVFRFVPCLQRRPLVEVFLVRINDIVGWDKDNLYGNITVTDGLGSQNIFKDGEFIRQGENACLIGPARSISADDSFTIKLDLKNRYRWIPDISSDSNPKQEVSIGQISWNVYDTTNEYDKLLSKEVRSQYGSVTVNYAVLSDAVEATVEVTFENKDGESSADIYGWITASNVVSESELFRKAKNEHICVKHGEKIPLSRSVVAVPFDSALIVSAELWDHCFIFSDKDTAKHTAKFPAQVSDASEKKISGEYGAIKVKVTWNKYRDTIPEVIPDSEKYPPGDEL